MAEKRDDLSDHQAIEVEADVADPFGVTVPNVKPEFDQEKTLDPTARPFISSCRSMDLPELLISAHRNLPDFCEDFMSLQPDDFSKMAIDKQQGLLFKVAEAIKESIRIDGPLRIGFHGTTADHIPSLTEDVSIIEMFQVGGEIEGDVEQYFYQLCRAVRGAGVRGVGENILTFIYSDPDMHSLGVLTGDFTNRNILQGYVSADVAAKAEKRNQAVLKVAQGVDMDEAGAYKMRPTDNRLKKGSPFCYHAVLNAAKESGSLVGHRNLNEIAQYQNVQTEIPKLMLDFFLFRSVIDALKHDVKSVRDIVDLSENVCEPGV